MKINCLIQARLTSSRFPGKVLSKIFENKSIIEFLYERIKPSRYINKCIFVIPNNNKNFKLKKFLEKKKIPFFLGSELNVLERYYMCAQKMKTKIVIRVTSDCPLVDYKLIDICVDQFLKKKLDYLTSRSKLYNVPDGLDVEVFSFKLLEAAYKNSKKVDYLEHVTNYIIKNKKYKKSFLKIKKKFNKNVKLSIDTKKDLKYTLKFIKTLKEKKFDFYEIKKKINEI